MLNNKSGNFPIFVKLSIDLCECDISWKPPIAMVKKFVDIVFLRLNFTH